MANTIKIIGVWKPDGSYEFVDEAGSPRSGSMSPTEHLTASVVGCAGITMQAVLAKMRIDYDGITITGIARKADATPTWIESVALEPSLQGADIGEAQMEKVLELTEKYCIVAQTLLRGAHVGFGGLEG